MAADAQKQQTKRVFINNVDKYTSKQIGKFLSSCVVRSPCVPEKVQDELVNEASSQEAIYQIVGTVTGKTEEKSSFAIEEYTNLTREELFHHLMESDVIIYNIYNEHADQIKEALWAVSALHKEIAAFPAPKMFILISSVMTWALTMTLDPNNPEIRLTECDYRRRKPHPNFKDHIAVEKLVVKLGKSDRSQFSTYVVASGLQYGEGEQAFHFFFKTSWLGEEAEVPIFGDGSNIIPTIYINDLAGIVQNVIERKPKMQYFLAVDESQNTVGEIISAIALALTLGKTKNVPKEDAFLTEELTQSEIDHLFINLRMEAFFLNEDINKENFNISWVSNTGIVENINRVVEEYKLTRGLLPVRICLLGPPAVGKSTIAKKICKHYKLSHVQLRETIAETLANLESRVRVEESNKEDESREARELLETLTKNMEKNGGWLDEQYVIQIIKDKLRTRPCRNQGFVLDGIPKTYNQAKELFSAEVDQAKGPSHNKEFIPEFVFFLDATDEFLEERVLNLPESVVQGTSHSVETYFPRLATFRKNYSEEESVLKYFDEFRIPYERIEINSDDLENVLVMEKVMESVGKARNYGGTAKDLEEEWRQAEIRLREKAEARQAEAQLKKDVEEQRAREQEELNRYLEKEREQEEALLMAQSAPLRQYLMNSVLPTVIQGCLETCKLQPDDPINFLGEYILKNDPVKHSGVKDELQRQSDLFTLKGVSSWKCVDYDY
ncbi:adenylate kinase 7-like [Clarias gariepinus]|uniref:adenylate kinase 7-like n=1 Tax=Clarias gariepinus TaxID=13013 RepID=UPI00234CB4A0|nr:adenylate kinase 7-like [Clarias gariepinus]